MALLIELTILADWETSTQQVLDRVEGTMEEKQERLRKLGVFEEYKLIHQAYSRLLPIDTTQEALKRALFIQWFWLCEPAIYSGIDDIDPDAELTVLTRLDQLLSTSQTDAELTCMLRYYVTWDYVFQRSEFQRLRALQAFVEINTGDSDSPTNPPIELAKMTERGQMGSYWLNWGGWHVMPHI